MTSSLPQDAPPAPDLRASDADREAVVRTLHDAGVTGLLTMEECDERVTAAYAARFVRELPPLTADLPPAGPPAPVAPGWRALLVLAWLQLRTALEGLSPGGRLGGRRLAIALVAVLALVSLGAATAGQMFGGGFEEHQQVEFRHR